MSEASCPLARRFIAVAHHHPEAPALLGADGELIATRRDLVAHGEALAEVLAEHLRPGVTVALAVANAGGLVPIFLALRLRPMRVALVDAAAPLEELVRSARAVGANALIAPLDRLAQLGVVWSDGDLALAIEPAPESREIPSGTAVFKLTSGSTGTPRGVALSVRQLTADTAQIMRTMDVRPGDITLAAIPMTHSYGLSSCLLPLLLAGCPLAFPTCALPAALVRTLVAAKVAHFPAVPAMIRAIATLPELPAFSDLRVCLAAGAPLAPADAAAWHAATGHKVHVFYGSSECGGITYDRTASPVHSLGCVGTAMERVTVEVVDESGEPVPTGSEGRVKMHSRAVALGTLPPSDPVVLRRGVFLTGDLGVLDTDGRLTLTGRVADVLNVAGKKVHPDEVRRVIEAVPGVSGAVVIGLPDPHRGDLVAAVIAVERSSRVTVRAVLATCRARLAPHKVPRRVVLVDALPFSERGKLRRDEIVRLLTAPGGTPPRE